MTTRKKSSAKSKAKAVAHAPDQTPEARKWSRAEAETHIRSLNLRCLGPRDQMQMERWQGLMAEGKADEARTVATRVGCGYDFGLTVVSEPFDGSEHETPCPKCGVVTSWRSPVFEGLTVRAKAKG